MDGQMKGQMKGQMEVRSYYHITWARPGNYHITWARPEEVSTTLPEEVTTMSGKASLAPRKFPVMGVNWVIVLTC